MIADNDNQPIRMGPWLPTREMAQAAGSKQYFTGKPCKRGHISPSTVSSNNCIACMYEVGVAKRKSPETADSVRKYMREYQIKRKAEDPEFLARARELGRIFDSKPERRKRQGERRKWRVANEPGFREKINAKAKPSRQAWKKANPEKLATNTRNRRARMRASEGRHTASDIQRINAAQGFKCAECGISTKKKKHVDHIMPIALGGSNWPDNLQILCPLCNDIKGAKHPIDFAQSKGRLL